MTRLGRQEVGNVKAVVGVGMTGRCYAIPTMDGSIDLIRLHFDDFTAYAKAHPELTFLVVMCKKLVASVDRFDKVVSLTEFLGEDNLPGKPLLVRFVNRSLDVISF